MPRFAFPSVPRPALRSSMLAIGLLAGTAQAYAQSSVTLSGTVDGGVRYLTNAAPTGGSVVTMNSNGYYSSNKLDFGGREDLGGSLYAHFLLESGFNLANGMLDNTTGTEFNRQAYVGIGGKYGAIDLGRQYTIAHTIIQHYDPFHFHFTPLIPLTTAADGTRFNNDVKYHGEFGPLLIEADNGFGGVAGNFSSGATHGIGMAFSQGPVSVGGVVEHRNTLNGAVYQGDDYYMGGASFKIGPVTISGGYMNEQLANASSTRTNTRNLFGGGSYRFTRTLSLTLGYYQTQVSNDAAKQRDLGVMALAYKLSKRTTAFAEADYAHFAHQVVSTLNTSGAKTQTGVTVGIDHMF